MPTSRADEIVRDGQAQQGVSLASHFRRGAVTIAVAVLSAGAANAVSDSTVLVMATTAVGLTVGYALVWTVPITRALRASDRTEHWRSQVFQAAPECVEFDLWSECDHEVSAIRAEVLAPDGATYPCPTVLDVASSWQAAGTYVGVGNYPSHNFPGAPALVDGQPYTVVWYGKRLPDSPWMEIARQRFTTPIPDGKVVQQRPQR